MPPKVLTTILAAWLSLFVPAAHAGSVDRVAFSIPATVKAQLLSHEPGLARYRVASNAGFTVHGQNLIGDIQVDLAGQGSAAQMPGPTESDTFLTRMRGVIYKASRKTAARPGTLHNQSVVIEIRYPETASSADFIFKPAS